MNSGAWKNDPTGSGVEGDKLKDTGCAITLMSNILSTNLGENATPDIINNDKKNFVEKTDDLNMQKVGEDNQLKFDYWI